MTKPTLVAMYARVSTDEQNPEAQLLALREYADRRGFSIYEEYVDHVSGDSERRRVKGQNNGACRAPMDDAGRRRFDCVLVLEIRPVRAIFEHPEAGLSAGTVGPGYGFAHAAPIRGTASGKD